MNKPYFYITTPIYYPSDKLHIGHAYCTTIADALARYHRLLGEEVFFLTGSDEHGQKIQDIAQEKHISPQEYVDNIVLGFKQLWEKMNISNDGFIRTTDEGHCKAVQLIFQKLYDKGDIYKSNYEGLYCTPCESFWLERQLNEDGNCPDCGRPVKIVTEESYFFKLSKYQDKLLQYIENNPTFIMPASRRNEMVNFIKSGLEDLCVSRTTFDWGIPVPFDTKHVIYVWFDALTNYITALGYADNSEQLRRFWPANVHLVGKEIARFHTIIWPAVLMALDLPLPKQVYGHGWLIMEGDKMSKSKGNIIDPLVLIEKYGVDAIRYFLLREMQLGQDGNFSNNALINRINADLANDLGNLLHRTVNMLNKFNIGVISKGIVVENIDIKLKELALNTVKEYEILMNAMDINQALKAIWTLIGRSNKYIDETGPWTLAKQDNGKERLNTVLYNLAEILRIVSVLLSPFMPQTAQKIYLELGLVKDSSDSFSMREAYEWGMIKDGTKVSCSPQPIFPRIETDSEKKDIAEVNKKSPKSANNIDGITAIDEISIDDFNKIELKVAKIIAAEKIPKADRLLLLKVDLGDEIREIVSGIAMHYTAETLIGLDVLVITNLKEAKIRGIKSKGMILAASQGEKLKLVTISGMPAGSRVK